MIENLNQSEHIIFLGLADHHRQDNSQPFPLGGIDLYQLSRHKSHIVYPGLIGFNEWVLLVSYEFLRSVDLTKWSIRICDENDHEVGTYNILNTEREILSEEASLGQGKGNILIYQLDCKEYSLLHFSIIKMPKLVQYISITRNPLRLTPSKLKPLRQILTQQKQS